MNAEEQANSIPKNRQAQKLVDEIILTDLHRKMADEEPLSAAMIKALTSRYGAPKTNREVEREVENDIDDIIATIGDPASEAVS
jgi:predicted component of type VI protein secretion system